MAKIAFYLNSKASSSQQVDWESYFRKYLFRHELFFYSQQSLLAAKQSIHKNAIDEVEVLFLIGGDGTINSLLPQLIGSDFKIIVIPTGTANDLARELGLSRDIKKIIKTFQYKTMREVDVISVNGNYFLTVGGLGIANQVVQKINKIRKDFPSFKKVMSSTANHFYGLFLAKELLLTRLKRYQLKIEVPGEMIKLVEASMLYISNQEYLGTNFQVAPGTVNSDGQFHVSIFCHKNKRDLIKAISAARFGNYPTHDKNLIYFETDRVKITHMNSEKLPFFGDGEDLDKANFFDIKVLPKKLNFFCKNDEFNYDQSYSLSEVQEI